MTDPIVYASLMDLRSLLKGEPPHPNPTEPSQISSLLPPELNGVRRVNFCATKNQNEPFSVFHQIISAFKTESSPEIHFKLMEFILQCFESSMFDIFLESNCVEILRAGCEYLTSRYPDFNKIESAFDCHCLNFIS
jgi:hypothetical protein